MFRSNSITDFKLRAKKVVSRRRSRSHGEGDLDEYGPLIQQIHSKICPVEKVSDKKIEDLEAAKVCYLGKFVKDKTINILVLSFFH